MRRWFQDRSGATSIEYALIAVMIAAAAVTGIGAVGSGTNSLYGRVGAAFNQHLP